MWSDGTKLPSAPMTGMQWLIWSLAAAGKFFEGFVVFMTGVALPLLSREFGIGPAANGLITAATLFGTSSARSASGVCRTASAARSCSSWKW
jgi:putative MFS transporter